MPNEWPAQIAFSAAAMALAGMIAGFFVGWLYALGRWNSGQPLLEFSPRRPVPWTLVTIAVSILAFFLFVLVTVTVLRATGIARVAESPEQSQPDSEVVKPSNAPPNHPVAPSNHPPNNPSNHAPKKEAKQTISPALMWIESLTKLVFVGMLCFALFLHGANSKDLGFSLAHWKTDIVAGVLGFCMTGPFVLTLQAVLVNLWKPSSHPLIESLREQLTFETWLAAVAAAVLAAPFAEEFLFRVVLQGWLERVVEVGDRSSSPPPSKHEMTEVAAENLAPKGDRDLSNPYVTPSESSSPPEGGMMVDTGESVARTLYGDWLPVIVSSLIFALVHYNHGPDWIALIPFAMLLGFLYRRTHRIWASMVAHLMLNAFSMTMLTYGLLMPPALSKS